MDILTSANRVIKSISPEELEDDLETQKLFRLLIYTHYFNSKYVEVNGEVRDEFFENATSRTAKMFETMKTHLPEFVETIETNLYFYDEPNYFDADWLDCISGWTQAEMDQMGI